MSSFSWIQFPATASLLLVMWLPIHGLPEIPNKVANGICDSSKQEQQASSFMPISLHPDTSVVKREAQPDNQQTGPANEIVVQDAAKSKLHEQPAEEASHADAETLLTGGAEMRREMPRGKILMGVVTGPDATQPLAGVIVKLSGSSFGAVTDANGHFVLHNLLGNKKLEVSYIGYATQQVKVDGSESIKISLQPIAK